MPPPFYFRDRHMGITSGLQLRTRRGRGAEVAGLISSMRFAISLLTAIAIVSVIGPFRSGVFDKPGRYAVYSAWWFLLTLAFLVVSTSLCIVSSTPKMLKGVRSWRENLREQSLQNSHHKA